ncbi:protein kinase activity protein [Tritrichomonas musculus]|uniref:Protein kinase activity protein n=1 Tax=Tritrichomonas musculus TaxID=1915356 RepID=A0ABR2KIK1_9EUKA
MKVCGFNNDIRLNEASNKRASKYQCISPPCDSHLNISSLSSLSACHDHTIWITKEGEGYAVGSNRNGQILGTHKNEDLTKEELIELKDKEGRPCQIISAVCGQNYTLYLFCSSSSKNNQLAYVHKDHKRGAPVFVNINGHNPIHLFGGYCTAAAVDTEGSIFYITSGDMKAGRENIEKSVLPQSEKAVSIACCRSFVIASGSSGRAFCANVPYNREAGGQLAFDIVKELEGTEIIEVSGIYDHCLAVCKDGRVFVRGSDRNGSLGLGGGRSSESEFTEIRGLKHKIISASAGGAHSLFITSEGKVLACGWNNCGQLLTTEPGSDVYTPSDTTISSGASFSIAGGAISLVFVGTEPPPNTPNRPIRPIKEKVTKEPASKVAETPSDEILRLKEEIAALKEENSTQKEEIAALKEENSTQKEEIERQKEENSTQKEEIAALKEENSTQKEEIERQKEENSTQKEEIERQKEENSTQKEEIAALKEENSTQKEEIERQKEENERLRGQVSSSSTAGSLKLLDASTIESLDRCEEVGSGGFGRVYKVYKKEACALKEMNASEPIQRNFGYFLKECELLCMLRHPNIEKTFGIFMGDADRRPCMLLEFCCQNLETAVKNKILSGVESSFCLYQVAEGMKYVHSRGIIHRDLKPSNILFGSDGMIKIGDFGIARLVTAEEQSSMTRGFGTQKFMAPEIIDESDTYDEKVDVYSFGVLCFFVLSGGEMPKIKMSELLSGKKAAIPSSFSDISKSVISDCWNFESKDRPSFSEIVSRMEKNDYEMVPLEESQVRELKNKVKEHKAKIPPYK